MRIPALSVLTMVTVFGATAADAQRLGGGRPYPGASYPVPGSIQVMQQPGGNLPPPPQVNTLQRPYPGQSYPSQSYPGARPVYNGGGSRWGGSFNGRWSGGVNAPGGWNAYRRPTRGYRLPSYWISPNFFISDFGGYGLYAPPQGYGWQRYYDDAVLVDPRGRVRDSVYGINWDGGYAQGGYAQSGYAQDGYASSEYSYAQGGQGYVDAPQYQTQYQTLPPVVQNGGVTTYSTTNGYSAGGYASGGYSYPGATTTVVTIMGAPTVTTTTTEYIEEVTRTRYVAPRRVYRAKKRVYRPVRCVCHR